MGPEPSRDDDPTGVRALLSSLAQPDPMPEHLVERINASLAAEQRQRAARMSGSSVTPLLATARRRPARLVFAIAGAAAAIALVAVVSTSMFHVNQQTTARGGTALASTSSDRTASGDADQGQLAKGPTSASRGAAASLIQIRLSETRYTRADFVTQARSIGVTPARNTPGATIDPPRLQALSGAGPAATTSGLMECLSAIGVSGAQSVSADVAFYEGQPAVVIVITKNGKSTGYAVGRQCSRADVAVMRTATPLS